MAQIYVVKCINKIPRIDPYEALSHIGGLVNGRKFKHSQQEAIRNIESNTAEYIVQAVGHSVKVEVGRSPKGNKCLRTKADNYKQDNLLNLPECP